MEYPAAYRYTKEHEWISVRDGLGTIGLTDHAQCELGDVVYVELPGIGTTVEVGKPLGVVESVKSVSEIYSPVSGEVVETNDQLKDHPESVNSEPHGAGWLVKVRLNNATELEALMDAEAYQAYVAPPAKG